MPSLNLSKLACRNPNRPTLKQRAAALKATAARVLQRKPADPLLAGPDPAITAIEVSRAAEAAMNAWQARFRGAAHPSEADFAEEDRLGDVQIQTRDAALSTVPTTRAGQLALLDYVRFQMEMHGLANGDPPDADDHIWRDTHKALSAALAAPVVAPTEPEFGLAGLDLSQLRNLHTHIENVWEHMSAETQAPWCWDGMRRNYNAAGLLLEEEGNKLLRLLDAIDAEVRRRTPAADRERDARLYTLVRHELLGEGWIADRALFAEMVAAWGEPTRG